jgi:hypothetical protein
MLNVLGDDSPGQGAAMADDPFTVLSSRADVRVRYATEAQTHCGVHGSYDGTATPATINVRRTYARHEAFTVLHEFGHHVQQALSLELSAAVIDHPHGDALEELACEAFAALVLLPDSLVEELTPTAGASAETIAAYYARSLASRSACCVRALPTLVGGGVIAVLDAAGRVKWAASSSASVYAPARGSDQSGTPLVERALARPDGVVTHDETFIVYSTHEGTETLYGQACWIDGWIVGVLKTDNVSWRSFAPPRPRRRAPRPSGLRAHKGPEGPPARVSSWRPSWGTCVTCNDSFPVSDDTPSCSVCGELRCERGHCACTTTREVRCSQCFTLWSRARFAAPDAAQPVCRECTDD